ncbi:hypothetical protein JCM19294_1131 [Nonlabens tegetincola]|uniref:Uncharacterized protein n=1 Tax=Nonlabens tegetincola TaxID=323273 RepID=A0A090Q3P6_9FLAO|nr:hypothetical protein [Nonlabens tegetincola]GAK96822.1 hypothetical protein JCM19294_1131 [Nonlabens tegetincola]
MEGLIYLIVGVVFLVIFVIAMRLLGAWMLRINEILRHQQILINEVKKLNGSYGEHLKK